MDKEFASRENIKMLQGISIMLMVFHHLFGFSDRISVPYYAPFDFKFIHLETILAYWGRICVAIFSFCSGYGLYQKNTKIVQKKKWTLLIGYKEIFYSIKKFYFCYWMIFITFVPYGFYKRIYEFVPLQFVKNVLGIACTYNKEWWYVYTYLRLLVVFPLLFYFAVIMIKKGYRKSFLSVSIAVIFLLFFILRISDDIKTGFLTCFLSFYIGMLVAEFNIFEKIFCRVKNRGIFSCSIVFIAFIISVGIRVFVTSTVDFLIVPVLIFCLIYWFHSKWIFRPLKYLLALEGKYSQYIWLTHTFFSYYYFQKQLYALSVSWIIFGACLIVCTCIGMFLESMWHIWKEKSLSHPRLGENLSDKSRRLCSGSQEDVMYKS